MPALLTELIPRRNSTYVCVLALGCLIIGLMAGLYYVGMGMSAVTTDGMVAAFDLDAEGSIACWFSIVLLFTCAGTCLLIARIEREKSGRISKPWLLVAMVWLTMSLDEGASLHEGFKELMRRVCGTSIMGDGSIYWVGPYLLLLSVTGCFVFWSVRQTPLAIISLLGAGTALAVAVASQLEWMLRGVWPLQIVVEECAEMLGYLLIWLTLGFHARGIARAVKPSPTSERFGSMGRPHFPVETPHAKVPTRTS